MPSTYISPFDYARSPSGLEFTSLFSNMLRIGGSGVIAGATTITILPPGLNAVVNPYDRISIFDGLNSEVVNVTVTVDTLGVQSIQCSPLQFSHAVGTPICGDGVLGSLSDTIFYAGTWLETICRQSLWVSTYTNEQLAIPTMRASIDNFYSLHFRPRHWPIQSLTSLSIFVTPGNSIAYDPTQVVIDSDKQICSMPNMQPLPLAGSGQAPYPIWNVISRSTNATVLIQYNSGFTVLPNDVVEASILLTSDILAVRQNPIGAPDLSSGSRHIGAALRGDNSGDSLLAKRAKKILDNYTVQSF